MTLKETQTQKLYQLLSSIKSDRFDYTDFAGQVSSIGEFQRQKDDKDPSIYIPGMRVQHSGSTKSPLVWTLYVPVDTNKAQEVWDVENNEPSFGVIRPSELSSDEISEKITQYLSSELLGFESFVNNHTGKLIDFFHKNRVLNWGALGNSGVNKAYVAGFETLNGTKPFASIIGPYDDEGKRDYDVVRVDDFTVKDGRASIPTRGFRNTWNYNNDLKRAKLQDGEGLLKLELVLGGSGIVVGNGSIKPRKYYQRSTDVIPNVPIWHNSNYSGQDGWVTTTQIDKEKLSPELLEKTGPKVSFHF